MCPQCWEWISFRYPLQILQMVAVEAILSCPNAIKPLVSAPFPEGESGCGPWCLSPPVGECCPLVGVPPIATTEKPCRKRVYPTFHGTLKRVSALGLSNGEFLRFFSLNCLIVLLKLRAYLAFALSSLLKAHWGSDEWWYLLFIGAVYVFYLLTYLLVSELQSVLCFIQLWKSGNQRAWAAATDSKTQLTG